MRVRIIKHDGTPGHSWGFRGVEVNRILLREDGPDTGTGEGKAACMIYSSDAGVFAVSSDTSVFINRKALSTPRELRSGDIIGIGKRRFAVEFFEAPARFGNVRQSPEEESLGVVYEKLKSVFRWVGLMRD